MNDLHDTQVSILNKLLFTKDSRYSDLKVDKELENNTFQFHLDKVIKDGYVKKGADGFYSLTTKGKKLATHIDTDSNKVIARRKVSVRLYCIRGDGDDTEMLIYTRLKHPFYGKQGFPSGKVAQGENFADTARRELLEETNLTGDPVLFNMTHYLVKDKDTKELLEDKLLLDHFILNPKGTLKGNKEGEFIWIKVDEMRKIMNNPFDNIDVYVDSIDQIIKFNGAITFNELDHYTSDF